MSDIAPILHHRSRIAVIGAGVSGLGAAYADCLLYTSPSPRD